MFWKKKKEKPDQKVHVAPTISVKLKTEIERLAFILDQSVGYVGELLFEEGLFEREVVERFAPHFRKDNLIFENTYFISHPDNPSLSGRQIKGPTDRISIRFDKDGYHNVDMYADMLGVSDSAAVALVIDASIKHAKIIEYLIQKHNNRYHFDEIVLDETKKLIHYINRDNPYKAVWNQAFVDFVEGPRKKPRSLGRPITPECVDTETYRWNLD